MSKPVYRKSPGFHISQKDAEVLGPAFERLERRLRRPVTPADVVEEAEKPASPFHKHFTWNDTEAAIKYRLVQAQYLMRGLDVILSEHGDLPVRAIIPVRYRNEGEDEEGGYMSTVRAAKDRPDVIRLQVKRAKDDARIVYERYQAWISFAEFEPAFDFIAAAKELSATA